MSEIVVANVAQGSVLVPSVGSVTKYVADSQLAVVAGLPVTRSLVYGLVAGVLLKTVMSS